MNRTNDLIYIRENVSETDLYGQLAEECAELAQAALKMQRLLNGTNPPRRTAKQCLENLQEEIADVDLCISLLMLPCDDGKFWDRKIQRWIDSLREARGSK